MSIFANISQLFSIQFMPHGHCYHWIPSLVFLHVFSDGTIALSYLLIPFGLVYFVHKRKDLPFNWIFFCFCAFIIACGTTHAMEIWTLWHADYWVSGFIKLFTGIISFSTAILLYLLIPTALALPGPNDLRAALEKQKLISKELAERTHSLEIQQNKTNTERFFKNQLSNIIESSIEYAIIATDLKGNIILWNEGAHQIYGYKAEEVNQKNISLLYTPEDINEGRVKDLLNTALEQRIERSFEHIRKDGLQFTASVAVNLRYDQNNEPVGYVFISKNIEKEKEYEERITKTNQELEQFAYITSHDLKAPLRSITSLINWIEEDKANTLTEESKEHFNLLISRANRMNNLIEGILTYSRIGRVDFDITKVSIKNLIQEILETLDSEKKVKIHYAEDLPIFTTSKIPLLQVFTNLLNNAIKYNDKPEVKIEIGYKDQEKYYEFYVTDNGPGIDPEYHQKIFEIFQTLQSRDEIESTGIGLSIVKKIVESRGGKVTIESAVGAGTTFRFTWIKQATPISI